MSELGNLLKKLRGKRSLRDIAEATGLSHTYISDVEKGFRRGTNNPLTPSPDTLKRLSKAYNYPYEELLRVAGILDDLDSESTDDDNYDYSQDPTVTGELRGFLDILVALSEEEQDEIIQLAMTYVAGKKARNRSSR